MKIIHKNNKKITRYTLTIFTVLTLIGITNYAQVSNTNERDLFFEPFTQNSIWNMPIGSNAEFAPAGFKSVLDMPNQAPYWRGGIGIDAEPIAKTTINDPLVDVYKITDWSYRCNSNQSLNKKVRIPSSSNYPSPNGNNNTPNFSGAFVQPDGSIFHFNAIATCGNNKIAVYDYTSNENDSLTKNGHEGGHGGSGLSGIGGTIRKGELTNNKEINHALKLNVFAGKYLTYINDSTPGYKWPANRADGYANGNGGYQYGSINQNKYSYTEMGALVALKNDVKIDLKTPVAKKIYNALIDYGAYIVDDTHWNHYDLPMEIGVEEEVRSTFGIDMNNTNENSDYFQDMMNIITNLSVVTNNEASTIGGGGAPRKPLKSCHSEENNCSNKSKIIEAINCSNDLVKVMPLGDSITEHNEYPGSDTTDTSYRALQWKKLHDTNLKNKFTFVGLRNDSKSIIEGMPTSHAGYGGYTTQNFIDKSPNWGWDNNLNNKPIDTLMSLKPDIVQIMLGTNDGFFNVPLEDSKKYWNIIINTIRNANPNAKILIGLAPVAGKIYNEEVTKIASNLNNSNSQIEVISFDGYDNTKGIDTVDWVHNNGKGAEKMANAFSKSLKPMIESKLNCK